MSEPAPEPQQGGSAAGGFMSRKYMGIPAVVWLAGAAILAYLYFRNKSASSGGGATSTGGGGQSTTGDIAFQPAAETIDVQGQYGPNTVSGTDTTQGGNTGGGNTSGSTSGGGSTTVGSGTPNPQPSPKPKPPTKTNSTPMMSYTVKKGEQLDEIAKRYGISADCLADANVYVKGEVPGNKKVGQTLGTGAGLKTGQVLKIPHPSQCSKS